MYSGLQTKAIDGVELSFTASASGKFQEVTKYACETKHILLINFEVISSKWFNSLPVEYQKILEEECNRAGLEVSRRYLNEIDPRTWKGSRRGHDLIPQSEIDIGLSSRGRKGLPETGYPRCERPGLQGTGEKEISPGGSFCSKKGCPKSGAPGAWFKGAPNVF
jgi:hypothetical protein